jgi:hypothetical protein
MQQPNLSKLNLNLRRFIGDLNTEQPSLMPNLTMQVDLQQIPGRRITVDISNPV